MRLSAVPLAMGLITFSALTAFGQTRLCPARNGIASSVCKSLAAAAGVHNLSHSQ